MRRTDNKHPNNDCRVWSQLDRWQKEIIDVIKDDTGKTESEIVRKLLISPLTDYQKRRDAILSTVKDELKSLL